MNWKFTSTMQNCFIDSIKNILIKQSVQLFDKKKYYKYYIILMYTKFKNVIIYRLINKNIIINITSVINISKNA